MRKRKKRSDSHHRTVLNIARKDVAKLRDDMTVQEALDDIRQKGVGDRIVYFYVVDRDDRLAGVLPVRRLLTSPLETPLSDVMLDSVITISHDATILRPMSTL
jgi:magnesium transporter